LSALLLNDKPWFLTEGKSCCYIHHTFLLWFPTGWSFTRHQAYFLAPLPGRKKKTSARGVFRTHIIYFVLSFALLYFILLASFYQKPKKIRILGSCFYLPAFSLLEWLPLENTKLCDFTTTNNSDFICTPIAHLLLLQIFMRLSLLC
jgi:hypothetical protein